MQKLGTRESCGALESSFELSECHVACLGAHSQVQEEGKAHVESHTAVMRKSQRLIQHSPAPRPVDCSSAHGLVWFIPVSEVWGNRWLTHIELR